MNTLASKLHEAYSTIQAIELAIEDLFEKHDSATFNRSDFDYTIGADEYDNSIEIYFKCPMPYPYEPPIVIRKAIYAMGFGNIYWNFLVDKTGNDYDEVRNYEPRHYQSSAKWISCKYGYADERWNQTEWEANYKRKNE